MPTVTRLMGVGRWGWTLTLVVGALLATSTGARAQDRGPDPSQQMERDCRRAARIVERGRPAKKQEWAFGYISRCGAAGGTALGQAIRHMRSETDTAALTTAFRPTWWYRDAEILAAASDVAQDPGASVPARVYSLLTLATIVGRDVWAPYEDLISVGEDQICRVQSLADPPSVTGAALPGDYVARARTLATSLSTDSAAPPEVRSAARCVYRAAIGM